MIFQGNRLGCLVTKAQANRGAEAVVWHVKDNYGTSFAVKAYTEFPSRHMQNELTMHRRLGKHDNISSPIDEAFRVKRHTSIKNMAPRAIVFKYYHAGDLIDHYEAERDVYSEEHLLQIMSGMWKGLAHCHKNDICHRDIKPQNILYDEDNKTVVLTDFGMSRGSTGITNAGTSLFYSAPECFGRKKHPPYDYKCDVWSAGTTYLTMMSGSHVIEGNGGHNLRRHGYKYIKNNFEAGWNGMSDLSKEVLMSTLIPDPRDRCEAEDIVRLLA